MPQCGKHRNGYSITSSASASNLGGNLEARALCRLKVKHERVTDRLFERQVAGARPLEDAVGQRSRPLKGFRQIRPIGHQAAVADQKIKLVDGRQFLGCGKFKHAPAIEHRERVGDHQDAVWQVCIHHREGLIEVIGLADTEGLDGHADRLGDLG